MSNREDLSHVENCMITIAALIIIILVLRWGYDSFRNEHQNTAGTDKTVSYDIPAKEEQK